MAGVVHISEEEAMRDFGAIMKYVRSGDEVCLDCKDGLQAVVKRANYSEPVKARNSDEIIEGFRQREAAQGLAVIDEDFAADVADARKRYNAPRDHSAWD